ncbi:hypothetical protein H6G36_09900 [Anabaena minutissima FACHB-250]|nr:hypothetical protein [Anabaena minutissima FACHB-250]
MTPKHKQKYNIISHPAIFKANHTRCSHLNLGTTLATSLLGLTVVSVPSAEASDHVVADSQIQLSFTHTLSETNSSQTSIQTDSSQDIENPSLSDAKQLYLSSKTIEAVKSQNIQTPEFIGVDTAEMFSTHSNAGMGEILAENVLESDEQLKPQNQPQIIAQTDSSGVVGDTLGDTNQLRQELLIEPIVRVRKTPKAAPGSAAGTPSAYGASFGQAYIGGGLSFPLDKDKDNVDGSLSVGFGLGDAVKSVGLEVNVNITSVGGGDNFDFGDSGGVGFKLHKYFTDGTAVAVGWSNAVKWGDVTDAQDTIYGVVTKSFPLQPNNPNHKLPLTLSAGLGSGSFRSKGAIEAGDNAMNLFGSLGLRIIPEISLVTSWTGNRLNMGASFAPLKNIPIVVNTIFTDVTSNFETGLGFTLSAGYTFRF